MFFTSNTFAGLHLTPSKAEFAFITVSRKRGKIDIDFTSAERCDRNYDSHGEGIKISREARALKKRSHMLCSTLPLQKTLFKKVALPKTSIGKQTKIAETLLYSGGVFEPGELTFAFSPTRNGSAHIVSIYEKVLRHQIVMLERLNIQPTHITAVPWALANFVRDVCLKKEGYFLYIGEEEAILIGIEGGYVEVTREILFDRGVIDDLVQKLKSLSLISNREDNAEPIYVTGPLSLDQQWISYLKAALGWNLERLSLERGATPAQLCHTFALAIGAALEPTLPSTRSVNFCRKNFANRKLIRAGLVQEGLVALNACCALATCTLLGHAYLEKDVQNKLGNLGMTRHRPTLELRALFKSGDVEAIASEVNADIANLSNKLGQFPRAFEKKSLSASLCEAAKAGEINTFKYRSES